MEIVSTKPRTVQNCSSLFSLTGYSTRIDALCSDTWYMSISHDHVQTYSIWIAMRQVKKVKFAFWLLNHPKRTAGTQLLTSKPKRLLITCDWNPFRISVLERIGIETNSQKVLLSPKQENNMFCDIYYSRNSSWSQRARTGGVNMKKMWHVTCDWIHEHAPKETQSACLYAVVSTLFSHLHVPSSNIVTSESRPDTHSQTKTHTQKASATHGSWDPLTVWYTCAGRRIQRCTRRRHFNRRWCVATETSDRARTCHCVVFRGNSSQRLWSRFVRGCLW